MASKPNSSLLSFDSSYYFIRKNLYTQEIKMKSSEGIFEYPLKIQLAGVSQAQFVLNPAIPSAEAGDKTVSFLIASKEKTPIGLYVVSLEKVHDDGGYYSRVPSFEIVVT